MCWFNYQAQRAIDEHPELQLRELYALDGRTEEELLDDVGTNVAGGQMDLGPEDFSNYRWRYAVCVIARYTFFYNIELWKERRRENKAWL